ncbi:hypothetical protein T484DRAFT_1893460, partial [Baffinella frigidus]
MGGSGDACHAFGALRVVSLGNALNEIGKGMGASGDAEASWRQGALEFSAVGDGANEALLRCNIAQLLRQRGEAGRTASAGGLGVREREAYAAAIGMCEAGLGCVGNRRMAPQVWALVHAEFARTAQGFAADLQTDMCSRRGQAGFREDGQLVVDLLLRAIALLASIGDTPALALAHLELGAFYATSLQTTEGLPSGTGGGRGE